MKRKNLPCVVDSPKDGDLGTSWTCTGDPREPNANGFTYYECDLTFGLVYFRNIKQVKIGETHLHAFISI